MTDTPKDSLNWAMICHLAGLTAYVGIPFGNVIAPVIIWLLKKDSSPVVMAEGREAVNFNISFTLYALLVALTCYILVGYALLPALLIVHIVLVVRAALKANKGESVRYPFTLRFIN